MTLFAISDAGWAAVAAIVGAILTFINGAMQRWDAANKDVKLKEVKQTVTAGNSAILNKADAAALKAEVAAEHAAETKRAVDLNTQGSVERTHMIAELKEVATTAAVAATQAAEKAAEQTVIMTEVKKAVNGPMEKKHTEIMTENATMRAQNEELIRRMVELQAEIQAMKTAPTPKN